MTESQQPADTSLESVVVRNPRTAARTVEGKALVVVIDRNELHTLNESGSFLWDACDGKTVGELVQLLTQRYRLDAGRARTDVEAFLHSMLAVDALELRGA